MNRREFHFSDGSSNKLWAIEVDGKSQRVHFGKIGTTGQAQTKDFASEDEAKKASDKLITEKVKKGYQEVTSGTKGAGTPTAKVKKTEEKTAEDPAEAPKATKPVRPAPVGPAVVADAAISRKIDLPPETWQCAVWRKRSPLPRPVAPPFDIENCRTRLSRVKHNKYGWPTWEAAEIGSVLSSHEAHFWFIALTKGDAKNPVSYGELAQKIQEKDVTGKIDLAAAIKLMKTPRAPVIFRAIFTLLDGSDALKLLQDSEVMNSGWDVMTFGLTDFTSFAFPYLSSKERDSITDSLRSEIDPKNWPTDFYKRPPIAFFLAALVGMPEELLAVSRSMRDNLYSESSWDHSYYHQTQRIVFGLGSPQLVESEMKRLKLHIRKPEFMSTWLALTEFSGLDFARDNILAETKKEICEELLEVFARVKAPEAAPHMLELKLSSRAPAVARAWLDEQVGNVIAGLIPTAAGRGKLAEAAIDYLREAKKKGHEKLICEALKGASSDVAESIRKNVLDHVEKEYALLDAKLMPAKLKASFEGSAKKGKLPSWATVTSLPPIIVNEKKLSDEQIQAVLDALQRSTLDKVDPLAAALKEHADASSLDAFAWKLFQLWQSEGCPSKEKWAMASIGLFGGDVSALKLTPLIRNWPGENQHQRAVFGLDCLRGIGTDTALMQLNGIAQKLKFKALKQKAAEAMEAIATNKGLSRSQLEDLIVPDCELDERGSRVFDFGSRQFRFVLGPDMKPMLKDADNKVKPDLPKPGAKDDAAKAEQATNDWKLMKKQIKEVTAIQAQRLEQAMITGRRWPVLDFETLLVKHPLMTSLVRLILWGGYNKNGKLSTTFRVTEDQTYANAKDVECKLQGLDTVGIVHPLHLSAEQQSAWGELFSDYKIVPPFRQLGRRIVRPERDELKGDELTRFRGISVPAPVMIYGLEKLGWIRGRGMDGGGFDEHSKPFPASNVTAVVHYEGNVGFGYIDPNETVKIDTCYFVKGMRGPSGYAQKEQKVTLGDVDPVAVSEVLTDMSALAAKGK